MAALFITATGTDIGKTFVAAGIVRALRRRGRRVRALKPVMSGFAEADAAASDAGLLLSALGRKPDAAEIARIAPWRFAAPLAPDMAARREGRAIDFAALLDHSRRAIAEAEDAILIEGVGGVMVPLDETHTVVDWIAGLGVPALLVAGSYLGAISHALTAIDTLRRRNIALRAVVVGESLGSGVNLEETSATIARFSGSIDTVSLPRLAGADHEHPVFERLADLA